MVRRRNLQAALVALVGILLVVGLSAATGALERERGCSPGDELCFGPEGVYYTVFDAPLTAQVEQAVAAAGITLLLFGAATYADHYRLVASPLAYRVAVSVVAFVLLFLLAVFLAPTVAIY